MIVSVPKETAAGERRVALTPDAVKRLVGKGLTVRIEQGAGVAADFPDDQYRGAGAEIATDAASLWNQADIVVMVQPPTDLSHVKDGGVVVGMFAPLTNRDVVRRLAEHKVTAFSLELLPRITRAQPMDVLSSMSTVAGYKAVLLAAVRTGKFFPMLVTAAGTIPPARVLILGAGVAGLQAIATARRLGAVVEAFDVRPAAKEQVESLGARFISADTSDLTAEGEGGYAKALSEEQHKRELALIAEHLKDVDVVVTTALIPGRKAPVLITGEMLREMKPGAVIVDLAAEAGGNCERTKTGDEVVQDGVWVLGPVNLPSSMAHHASQMYAKNLQSFLLHLVKDGALALDFNDEITGGTCATRDGQIVHEAVRRAVEGGSNQ
ncbi:MAG TPA: Re/Si-specific NAD(P)(+) transhydrogenase subunit alpha [Gemmatimonadales bacterium]|nr:Re/Si-specific NAD(P)(+) transhydrogenase subunit alpha [Gemmatimonadales bacterium]